jgi:hypothetical protein
MRVPSEPSPGLRWWLTVLCVMLALASALTLGTQVLVTDVGGGVFKIRDFMAFYASARAVAEGHAASIYDTAAMNAAYVRYAVVGPISGSLGAVMHPPMALFAFAPLAWMTPFAGYLAWMVAGAALLAAALYRLPKQDRETAILCTLIAPGMAVWILQGQMTALTLAAVFAFVHALATRNTRLTSACLALACIKPTVFLLLTALAFRARWWKALVWGTLASLALAGLAWLCFGPEVWGAFLAQAAYRVTDPAAIGSSLARMCNLRALLLIVLPEASFSMVQTVTMGVYALFLVAVARPLKRGAMTGQALAWALLGGVFFSPWLHAHDAWMAAPACFLVYRAELRARGWLVYATVALSLASALHLLSWQCCGFAYQALIAAALLQWKLFQDRADPVAE